MSQAAVVVRLIFQKHSILPAGLQS